MAMFVVDDLVSVLVHGKILKKILKKFFLVLANEVVTQSR